MAKVRDGVEQNQVLEERCEAIAEEAAALAEETRAARGDEARIRRELDDSHRDRNALRAGLASLESKAQVAHDERAEMARQLAEAREIQRAVERGTPRSSLPLSLANRARA